MFIYALSDPVSRSVRYVGKSLAPAKRSRARVSDRRPTRKGRWIRALLSPHLLPELRRARLSAALRGRPKSPEHVAKPPQNGRGRTSGEAQRASIAASQQGRKHRPGTIEKLRELNRGNQHGLGNRSRTGQSPDAEERRRKSDSQKGRPKSAEHRERIREGALRRWARVRADAQKDAGSPTDAGQVPG